MRIMYVLHRHHTNQIAIIKGWKEHGDELKLLTWYTGKVEDHTAVVPETLGHSGLFEAFYRFYMSLRTETRSQKTSICIITVSRLMGNSRRQ